MQIPQFTNVTINAINTGRATKLWSALTWQRFGSSVGARYSLPPRRWEARLRVSS